MHPFYHTCPGDVPGLFHTLTMYTEEQYQMADSILADIYNAGGVTDRNSIIGELYERYDYSETTDITLMKLQDDGFLKYEGRFIKLTRQGDKAARISMRRFLDAEKRKERLITIKEIMAIVASALSVGAAIGSFITYLISTGW